MLFAALARFAAAICHAGIDAGARPSCESGDDAAEELPCCACPAPVDAPADEVALSPNSDGVLVVLVPFVVAGSVVADPRVRPIPPIGDELAAPPVLCNRLLSRTLRLFNSELSSFSRFSLPSRAPSRALGMLSLSSRSSSLRCRVVSSRRRDAALSSATTLSTSCSAASKRCVRASSADLSAAVSFESCSMRANARLNCSSMLCLSCSSCGGVGGAISGTT